MPKILYEYVLFRVEDVAQLPIAYATIKDLSKMFNLDTQALHKRFKESNVIYIGDYGIERFKKESE
jgi:predicted hydrolase (HD superfamily)